MRQGGNFKRNKAGIADGADPLSTLLLNPPLPSSREQMRDDADMLGSLKDIKDKEDKIKIHSIIQTV